MRMAIPQPALSTSCRATNLHPLLWRPTFSIRSGAAVSDALENVLSRLHGVTRNGGGFMARCPAHEDRTASLSITERDGRILMKCHAGCPTDSVLGAIDLTMQ